MTITTNPVIAPTRTPDVAPEPLRRLMPGEICPAQKQGVTTEIERVL